jgi:hypothetical protein
MPSFKQKFKKNIKVISVLLLLAVLLTGVTLVRQSSTNTVAAAGTMCAKQTAPIAVKHIIWIWYENEGSAAVLGNSAAPYINSVANQCGYATQMLDDAIPSLASEPNYALGTAGVNCGNGTISNTNPTTGCITNDGDFTTGNHLAVKSIFEQLGTNWKSYQEGMQSNCALTNGGTLYAYKHNPAAFFTNISNTCKTNSVAFPAISCPTTVGGSCSGTPSGTFLNDLNAGTLPAFSFVTPNLVNDMHNNGVPPGDNWTKTWLPLITNSKAYLNNDTAIFLMWDESSGGGGNTVKIPNVVIAPSVKAGTQVTTATNNIGFLHTAESLLGLGYLGCATGKQANGAACPLGSTSDLGGAFNLAASNGTPTPTPTYRPRHRLQRLHRPQPLPRLLRRQATPHVVRRPLRLRPLDKSRKASQFLQPVSTEFGAA